MVTSYFLIIFLTSLCCCVNLLDLGSLQYALKASLDHLPAAIICSSLKPASPISVARPDRKLCDLMTPFVPTVISSVKKASSLLKSRPVKLAPVWVRNKGFPLSSLTGQVFRYFFSALTGQKNVSLAKISRTTPLPIVDSFGHLSLTFKSSSFFPPTFSLTKSMSSRHKVVVGSKSVSLWKGPHVLAYPHSKEGKQHSTVCISSKEASLPF